MTLTPAAGPGSPGLTVRFGVAVLVVLTSLVAPACNKTPTEPTSYVPVLLLPAPGAVLPNGCFDFSREHVWDFDWQDVSGATDYHLFVIGPQASVPIVDDQTVASSSYREASNGWISQLFSWRWRVRARVGGTFREWSEFRTFDVQAPNIGCDPGVR